MDRASLLAPAPRQIFPQHHHRQEADEADDDEGGLHDPRGDIAQRDRFALAPEDREQHDRRSDAGNREQDLQERAQGHLGVGTLAEDVVRVAETGRRAARPGLRRRRFQ